MSTKSKYKFKEYCQRLFYEIDTNQSGFISSKELKVYLKKKQVEIDDLVTQQFITHNCQNFSRLQSYPSQESKKKEFQKMSYEDFYRIMKVLHNSDVKNEDEVELLFEQFSQINEKSRNREINMEKL